jgi:hypothetical protein
VPLCTISANCVLKYVVLRNTAYKTFNGGTIFHLLGVSLLEQLTLLTVASVLVYCSASVKTKLAQHKHNNIYTKLYLSLIFPELLRIFAIVIQVFDTEPVLLLLFASLILSIQFLTFHCLTNIRMSQLAACVVAVIVLKVATNYAIYSLSDLYLLGIIG